MLDFCLELSKIKVLKMRDLQTKSAINSICFRVQLQATNQASQIPDFTNIAEFFPHYSNM
jgi:hypothetical protein